ncbi:hypothetical protein PR048_018358 [Dryococelus australis]|uniref:Uncharacterized protein n=1 Tax=Dryococelus australis TaxID=614101 RepID=A0ABQ9HC86_9NEOP|nr:hypothetical protein PR048_018358 [Dryococelus australis]
MSTYNHQKTKLKYRKRIRLERASQKQSSDTNKTPCDLVKRCRERKINIKASERINIDAGLLSSSSGRTPPPPFYDPKTLLSSRTCAACDDTTERCLHFINKGECSRAKLCRGTRVDLVFLYRSREGLLQDGTLFLRAQSKYRNRIRLERASQKQSSDTHKTPYDRVKRCRERKINIKASERVNVDAGETTDVSFSSAVINAVLCPSTAASKHRHLYLVTKNWWSNSEQSDRVSIYSALLLFPIIVSKLTPEVPGSIVDGSTKLLKLLVLARSSSDHLVSHGSHGRRQHLELITVYSEVRRFYADALQVYMPHMPTLSSLARLSFRHKHELSRHNRLRRQHPSM